MTVHPDFEDHRRLLVKMTNSFHRRCIAAGAKSVQREDVFQEMCIAWCLARDSWKPEITGDDGQVKKIPFVAYLVRGVRNHVNRWIGKEIIQANDKLELDGSGLGEESDGEDFHSVVADSCAANPEEAAIEADDRRNIRNSLSAEARRFLEILENPPPALFVVLDAARSRREFAVARGVAAAGAPKKITTHLVFDLMGIDRGKRAKIVGEIRSFINLETLVNG